MSEELLKPMAKVISFYSSRSGCGGGLFGSFIFQFFDYPQYTGLPTKKEILATIVRNFYGLLPYISDSRKM